MKKLSVLLLSIIMIATFCACSNSSNIEAEQNTDSSTSDVGNTVVADEDLVGNEDTPTASSNGSNTTTKKSNSTTAKSPVIETTTKKQSSNSGSQNETTTSVQQTEIDNQHVNIKDII